MKDASLRYIGQCILIAVALYVALNGAIFYLLYGDTFTPWTPPYAENFDQLDRLDYRQFGGQWKVQDGTLLQTAENDTDLLAVIPITLAPQQPYRFQAHITFGSANLGGGLMFNLQHKNTRQEGHMVRFGADKGQPYLVYGYFDDKLNFVAQGSISPYDLSATPDGVDLAVQVTDKTYNVLVNGSAAAVDIPVMYSGGTLGLTTWFSKIAFDNVVVDSWTPQAQAPAAPTAAATIAPTVEPTIAPTAAPTIAATSAPTIAPFTLTDSFDSAETQTRWQPFSGTWTFEQGALVQSNVEGFDFGMVLLQPLDQFTFRAEFSHRQGVGGGVLFNLPQPDSARGGHMVRYFEDNALAWGYFDSNGAFQGQGSALVTAPGTTTHSLEIRAQGTTYSIQLDGVTIAPEVPLVSPRGYVGLTASQSAVAFEQVDIAAGAGAALPESTPPAESAWIHDNDQIIQPASDLVERALSIGVHGETFDASVDITLPDNAASDQIGGGLIFHAPDPAGASGGYAVRLLANQQITWGVYKDAAGFESAGSAPVTASTRSHTLTLHVRKTDFDILFDGDTVASKLPLQLSEGWLFFSAVGGPVTFSNFTMTLSQIGN